STAVVSIALAAGLYIRPTPDLPLPLASGESTRRSLATARLPGRFVGLAPSARSQRAMRPTTTLTTSDLPRTVRGRPLVSVAVVTNPPRGCSGRGDYSLAVG